MREITPHKPVPFATTVVDPLYDFDLDSLSKRIRKDVLDKTLVGEGVCAYGSHVYRAFKNDMLFTDNFDDYLATGSTKVPVPSSA